MVQQPHADSAIAVEAIVRELAAGEHPPRQRSLVHGVPTCSPQANFRTPRLLLRRPRPGPGPYTPERYQLMSSEQLERSVLERKERDELHSIATAMGVKANTRTKKADLVDRIPEATGGG